MLNIVRGLYRTHNLADGEWEIARVLDDDGPSTLLPADGEIHYRSGEGDIRSDERLSTIGIGQADVDISHVPHVEGRRPAVDTRVGDDHLWHMVTAKPVQSLPIVWLEGECVGGSRGPNADRDPQGVLDDEAGVKGDDLDDLVLDRR